MKTEEQLKEAIDKFIIDLQVMMTEHYATQSNQTPRVYVESVGARNVRIAISRGESKSVYCFIDVATGNIMKPASWKAPEPKRYRRGNIYEKNNLDGCGIYGIIYLTPGRKG